MWIAFVALLTLSPPAQAIESSRVYVSGAVVTPGPYQGQGRTVLEVLDLAGGLTAEADGSRIVIVHRDGTYDLFDFAAAETIAGGRVLPPGAQTDHVGPRRPRVPVLRPGDSVLVPKIGGRP